MLVCLHDRNLVQSIRNATRTLAQAEPLLYVLTASHTLSVRHLQLRSSMQSRQEPAEMAALLRCCRCAELCVRKERQLPHGAPAEALAQPRHSRESTAAVELRRMAGCRVGGTVHQRMLI